MLPSSFENDFLLLHSLFFLVVQHNIPFLSTLGGVKHSLTEALACQSTLCFFLSRLFTEADTHRCVTRVPGWWPSPGTPVQAKVRTHQSEAPICPHPQRATTHLGPPAEAASPLVSGMNGTHGVCGMWPRCILGISGPDPSLSQGWRASGLCHRATAWRVGLGRVRAHTWKPGSPGFKCWGFCFCVL